MPRRSTSGRRPLAAVLFAAALAVAACGGSSGTSGPSGAPLGSAAVAGATAMSGGSAGASSVASSAASDSASASPLATAGATTGGLVSIDPAAAALEKQMATVIGKVNPSVVLIETDQGLGSGVVFDSQGHILTNAHVAGSATTFKVTTADGKSFPGTLVGTFVPDDVAVIQVKDGTLTAATFGDSSKLQVGDIVLAMGNPLGLQSSVTEGIVSALGRTVSEPAGNALANVIQTSAAINPGNSGGALVDLAGEVVGIPTLAASDPQMGGAVAGIGFAISSNRATDIARQLIATGHVTNSGRAFLGLELADTNAGQGVLVYSVSPNGPSAKAGVQAGDVITAVDGQATPDTATLSGVLAQLHPGDTAKLDVVHQDGTKATIDVRLGQMPG